MVIERSLTQVAGRRTQVCQSQRLLGTCSLKRKLAALTANGGENRLAGLQFPGTSQENPSSSAGQMLLPLHYQGFYTFIPTSENDDELFLCPCCHLDMSLSV